MRCVCCDKPFYPAIKRISGKVVFETLCSRCRCEAHKTSYHPNWHHEAISERPVEINSEE